MEGAGSILTIKAIDFVGLNQSLETTLQIILALVTLTKMIVELKKEVNEKRSRNK